ncbi:unnamed protein product [Cylicocyclus nassatus]|uniref:Uncharacterized protein n=1 Tax=Cylicocyclus nassatus TaxID=53992 RepID=A0AA36MEW0_CYLNA|nr:unnamed protein product [Cylicocyclus nassatus]
MTPQLANKDSCNFDLPSLWIELKVPGSEVDASDSDFEPDDRLYSHYESDSFEEAFICEAVKRELESPTPNIMAYAQRTQRPPSPPWPKVTPFDFSVHGMEKMELLLFILRTLAEEIDPPPRRQSAQWLEDRRRSYVLTTQSGNLFYNPDNLVITGDKQKRISFRAVDIVVLSPSDDVSKCTKVPFDVWQPWALTSKTPGYDNNCDDEDTIFLDQWVLREDDPIRPEPQGRLQERQREDEAGVAFITISSELSASYLLHSMHLGDAYELAKLHVRRHMVVHGLNARKDTEEIKNRLLQEELAKMNIFSIVSSKKTD